MVEKDFQNLFSPWIVKEENRPKIATSFELKLSKTNSIRFDAVRDIQRKKLYETKHGGMYHKLSDMPFRAAGKAGFLRFAIPKPCDCIFVTGEAYVVVMFWKSRAEKIMYFVDIDDWLKEEASSDMKSMCRERVEEISSHIKKLS